MLKNKDEIRKESLNARKDLTKEQKETLNKKIFNFVTQSDEYKNSSAILTYVSTENEIDTRKLIEHSFEIGKSVFVPVMDKKTKTMDFYEIKSFSELTVVKFGILEPEPIIDRKIKSFDGTLCIVPGLAFDKNGFRVGYGGGYYDKFLPQYNSTAMGLCRFDEICEQINSQSHDIPVNILATERGLIRIKSYLEDPRKNNDY